MCGIVGYTGKNQAVNFLVEGLKTLEYRGYDSAGVEVLSTDGELHGVKCAGRVAVLEERCKTANPVGTCLLYTSPSPRDLSTSRMPSSA